MPFLSRVRQVTIGCGLALLASGPVFALEMKQIGEIQIGQGEGYAEMLRYHAASKSLMVTASETGTIERISIATPTALSLATPFDLDGGNVTAVAVHGDLVAASIKVKPADAAGMVKLFDSKGALLATFETGALPDNVAFSPDGRYLLTANEGEPSDDYSVDPEGGFTLIDLASGPQNAAVTQIGLTDFDVPTGARIVKPGQSFAADAEPEYVAFSADGSTAYVTLQENNAVAVIDINAKKVADIVGLGVKNVSRMSHDMSNKDGGINMKRWPVLMMYQPDAIATYEINGATYLVTANEGDAKDYDGFSEETRVAKLTLDKTMFPNAEELQKPEHLGRLKTTTTMGDTDGDGDHDLVYAYGGRSFSIWAQDGTLLFDSGNAFEYIISKRSPDVFNANGGAAEKDDRSDDKGPEPEALALGTIGERTYAFIGMERNNAIFAYDITLPSDPHLVGYMMPSANHNSPEGLEFISAKDSPTGKPLLAIAFEMTGTVALYQID
ncbi:MAG: alkaline phosphatase [Oceanospirillales bacterium TMED33]|nr:alkaline phosphatase [Gammaproteobacteria bacterium]RPG19911.1 MAG: alkaline phosphatase [Oceanospirillales bacterium TMED33]